MRYGVKDFGLKPSTKLISCGFTLHVPGRLLNTNLCLCNRSFSCLALSDDKYDKSKLLMASIVSCSSLEILTSGQQIISPNSLSSSYTTPTIFTLAINLRKLLACNILIAPVFNAIRYP